MIRLVTDPTSIPLGFLTVFGSLAVLVILALFGGELAPALSRFTAAKLRATLPRTPFPPLAMVPARIGAAAARTLAPPPARVFPALISRAPRPPVWPLPPEENLPRASRR